MIRRPPSATRTTHSFPTRLSSDLCLHRTRPPPPTPQAPTKPSQPAMASPPSPPMSVFTADVVGRSFAVAGGRSEEHTSELQSLMRISYAVFCSKKHTPNLTTPAIPH